MTRSATAKPVAAKPAASRPSRKRATPRQGGTLVFCTAYSDTPLLWNARFRTWVDAIKAGVGADQILLLDDGSPVLPGWTDTRLTSGNSMADAATLGRPGGVMLHHFTERLGRRALFDFPGWYRSYAFGVLYGAAHGFDRIIHIESDAFLISPGAQQFFREFSDGWASLWCQKYNCPEIALQVSAGTGIAAMHAFASRPYESLLGHSHELALPVAHVERGLTGDRYGEDAETIRPDADYVAQLQPQREPSYYWWLPRSGGLRAPRGVAPGRLDLDFGAAGNTAAVLGDGWSGQEPDMRWMLAYQSVLLLPKLEFPGSYALRMTLLPNIWRDVLPYQRLLVNVNGRTLQEFALGSTTTVGCSIPARLLKRNGTDKLRLIHPDAEQPSALKSGDDRRRLSLAMLRLSLVPEDGS